MILSGLIDIHTHILPGADDGSSSMEETLQMLKMAKQQGISTIIATPHYISGASRMPAARLLELKNEVQEEADKNGLEIKVLPGNELYYSESILEELKAKKALTIAESRYVLVEFSIWEAYNKIYHGLQQLILAGYAPILAHVERYLCLKKKEELIEELIKSGVYIQMNSISLEGGIFDTEAAYHRRLLYKGMVHLVATDSHDVKKRAFRIQNALKILRKNADDKLLEQVFMQNPGKILKNTYI